MSGGDPGDVRAGEGSLRGVGKNLLNTFSIPSLRESVALQKIYAFTLYPACSFLLTASSMSAFTLRRLALARLAGAAVGNGRREAQRARGGRATAPAAAAAPGGPTGPC